MKAYLHNNIIHDSQGIIDLLMNKYDYSENSARVALVAINHNIYRGVSIKLIHHITDERIKIAPVTVKFKEEDYPFKVN